MSNGKLKKAGLIMLVLLLGLGLFALVLYLNRENLYPKVEEVTSLKVELAKDTALVRAGIQVQNRAPIPFRIDSVNYTIRNAGEELGWGGQVVGQRLPPLGDKVLDFRLFLDTERYRKHLASQQGQDSLDLDVVMTVYFDLPFMEQGSITFRRTVMAPVPKPPSFKIDSLLVKSFGPEKGYTFLLQLNAGNTDLPDLRVSDLKYALRFADNTIINGKIDSTFTIKEDDFTLQVPIKLETAEVVELIRKKLSGKKRWPYQAEASAVVHSGHPLFDELDLTVTKEGVLDATSVGGPEMAVPSVKRIKSLQLVQQDKKTYLKANLLVKNPGPLPLFIDSARYTVSYQGKVVARGSHNYEKTLPKNGTQKLMLQLAVNNDRYREMMQQVQGREKIPLDIKLDLLYDLEDHKPQRITLKKRIEAPVPENAGLEVAGLEVKELDPKKGAHLLLKLRVKNNKLSDLTVDDLNYNLVAGQDLEISGRTSTPITIEKGTSEIEVPLNLSAGDVNQLVRRLLQGNADWHYTFSGLAKVSSGNGMLQNTRIALKTTGDLDLGGNKSAKLMPGIERIDTIKLTIHYDTATIKLHVQVKNPLPVDLNVKELSLKIAHGDNLFGTLNETRDKVLQAKATTAAWLTVSFNYKAWDTYLKEHQYQDSLQLDIPLSATFALGNLPAITVPVDLHPRIPMPYSPLTIIQKMKFGGFNSAGIRFNAQVIIQNANAKNLEAHNTTYKIVLDNGVDFCGTINRTYHIPLDLAEVSIPITLTPSEAIKMMVRQFFGPPEIKYEVNATTIARVASPVMQNVYFIFENHNVTNLKADKKLKPQVRQKPPQTAGK